MHAFVFRYFADSLQSVVTYLSTIDARFVDMPEDVQAELLRIKRLACEVAQAVDDTMER